MMGERDLPEARISAFRPSRSGVWGPQARSPSPSPIFSRMDRAVAMWTSSEFVGCATKSQLLIRDSEAIRDAVLHEGQGLERLGDGAEQRHPVRVPPGTHGLALVVGHHRAYGVTGLLQTHLSARRPCTQGIASVGGPPGANLLPEPDDERRARPCRAGPGVP